MRPRISAASLRRTASGLIKMSVCWTATRGSVVVALAEAAGLLAPPTPPGPQRRHRNRGRLDRRLAERAHLPERLERRLARRARLLQLRRADRAYEVARVDLRPADRAVEVALREPVLHRLDLELALADVLEVLRR